MHTTEQLNTALTGRYVIDRLVGEGGMATVYLTRDVRHNRKVALKVLKPAFRSSEPTVMGCSAHLIVVGRKPDVYGVPASKGLSV